jgi:cytochrome c-type biogenesis protein CcmH
MKRLLLLLLLSLAAAVSHGGEAAPLAEDPVVEQRLLAISEEMRCLVCQNESLSASRSELAQDLRRELRTLIRQGKNDAEIRDFMVARYGDFVLYRPRVTPMTWALWFGPFLLMGAAVAVLFVFLRQRSGALSAQQEPMSEEEMKHVEAMLKGRPE